MNYRLIAPVLSAVLAVLLPRASFGADPYDIAVIAPLTGPSAFLGKEEASALEVLQRVVNASGGVRGRQIHFTIQDDQSIPQNTVQLLNGDIAHQAPVVIGSATTATCGAMTPLIASGPVGYCFSPGIHPPAGSYQFSAGASTADYIVASIRYLRGRGWRKIALMTSNDATGQDAERTIDTALALPENAGTVSLVDKEHFNAADLSVAAQIARIKSSSAQAVIFWAVGTSFGTLVREASQGGLSIPEVTSAGNLNYAQLIGYQSFMPDNLYIMAPPWAAPGVFPDPRFRRYLSGYLDAFRMAGIRPDQGQSIAWDPAQLVLDALRHLGLDATPAAIRTYLADLHGWTGVNGAYDFKAIPQRGIGIDWLVMVRWDKNKQSLFGVSKPGGEPR